MWDEANAEQAEDDRAEKQEESGALVTPWATPGPVLPLDLVITNLLTVKNKFELRFSVASCPKQSNW